MDASETKAVTHTEGPWHSRLLTGKPATRIYGGGRAGTKECRIVCELPYTPERQAEKKNNEWLILAAPDLLAACKAYYYGEKEARECEAMMGAAIAKAEGK